MKEFIIFGFKQAYASMFGGFLLGVMIITHYWYPVTFVHRYDAIFIAALLFQGVMLLFKWETLNEAAIILVFHLLATLMELFKTSDSIAAWHYPEAYVFGIGNVPLFTGFMYSAVGSYLARVTRIFHLDLSDYPRQSYTLILIGAIYINFFAHHFIVDLRWFLFAFIAFLFWKTQVHFVVTKTPRKMPILLGWLLISLFIWFAENMATYVNIWIYPNQTEQWQMVSLGKLSSWYLLMLFSFVLLRLIHQQPSKISIASTGRADLVRFYQ